MPDGAAAVAGAAVAAGLDPDRHLEYRTIPMSEDRGCGRGRDAGDRIHRPGRAWPQGAVQVEDAGGLTPLLLAPGAREWLAASMRPEGRGAAWAEETGQVVVIKAGLYVRIARVRARDP